MHRGPHARSGSWTATGDAFEGFEHVRVLDSHGDRDWTPNRTESGNLDIHADSHAQTEQQLDSHQKPMMRDILLREDRVPPGHPRARTEPQRDRAIELDAT